MQELTIAVAAAGVVLVMWLRLPQGFLVYIASVMFYSPMLTVPIGTIDLTVGRIVIAALLARTFLSLRGGKAWRLNIIDILVVLLFAWGTFALMITEGSTAALENRAGAFMDTVLVYLAARLTLTRKADFISAAKALCFMILISATLGITESLTGWTPYMGLRAYSAALRGGLSGEGARHGLRHGLYRASVSGANSIVFGMSFVFLMPFLLTLWKASGRWRGVATVSLTAAVVGTFSSMSSGPFMFIVVFCACALLILRPGLVKPVLIGCLLVCVAVEVASNRHFYHLIGYLALGSSAVWYRARLFEVAVGHLHEYWAFGYGFRDPGWGLLLDGRQYTDACNHYILLAVRHGILASAFFLGILTAVLVRLRRAYIKLRPDPMSDAAWYMASMFVALSLTLWSVGLMGVAQSFFYAMCGVVAGPLFESRRSAVVPGQAKKMRRTPSQVQREGQGVGL